MLQNVKNTVVERNLIFCACLRRNFKIKGVGRFIDSSIEARVENNRPQRLNFGLAMRVINSTGNIAFYIEKLYGSRISYSALLKRLRGSCRARLAEIFRIEVQNFGTKNDSI